jgi:aminopeptidase YwaD
VSTLLVLLAGAVNGQEVKPGHIGPQVAPGKTGPARFVGPIYEHFDTKAALATLSFVDGFYRAPGNEGYNACIDHLRSRLEAAGFGTKPGFELEEIVTPMRAPAWTPRSASLEVLLPDGEAIVLHSFKEATDVDRVMLPVNAPSADLEGVLVFNSADVREGTIFVSETNVGGGTIGRLAKQGALAVISAGIEGFTRDPSGGDEHLDAIQFRTVSRSVRLPVLQISQRSYGKLGVLANEHGELRLRIRAEVEFTETSLRTLVARIIGGQKPDEIIAMASHVQEPGAGDNASGVAGLCAAALALEEALSKGELARPARSLAFIWGDEMQQSAIWLKHNQRKVIAGISADMLGQSASRTGAICLLEREPDPGALDTLPPDKHTPWGAGVVKESQLRPSALSLIARIALVDVATLVGGWATSENPWEGGSDHDIFLARDIPGILIWHFTDFTYHTGLDRLDRLDSEELRRSATAILCTALAVADLRRADLERIRASNALELDLRVQSALTAERPDIAKRWREWCQGVELWLSVVCTEPEED